MLGALQIYAVDWEWERDLHPFPLPQMTQQVLGDGPGVGIAASEVQHGSSLAFLWGAASQSLALPSSPVSLLEAGMVLLGAGPSFCSSCLRSTRQWQPAHSPQLPRSALLCPAVRRQRRRAMPRQPITFWLASLSRKPQSYFMGSLQLL